MVRVMFRSRASASSAVRRSAWLPVWAKTPAQNEKISSARNIYRNSTLSQYENRAVGRCRTWLAIFIVLINKAVSGLFHFFIKTPCA
jgi:hypothetical protein